VDFDFSHVDGYAEKLQRVKASASPAQMDKATEYALRTAAVDTGALEGLYATERGFTRTVATQAAGWELDAAEKGDHVKGTIEDAITAYEMVLDAVTAQALPFITEAWLRRLHTVICASQQTYRVYVASLGSLGAFQDHVLPHGTYKQMPNSPTLPSGKKHEYASPLETPIEMARLVEELKAPEFLGAHPVMQAAYAHYAFVCIHPFADGNGRVARALTSVFLYRSPGVPLLIFADQRNQYLDALEAADAGRPDTFVRFIAERVIDTVNLVAVELSASTPDAQQSTLETIRSTLANGTDEDVLLAAERLSGLAKAHLVEASKSIDLPHGASILVTGPHKHRSSVVAPEGYRLISKSGTWITSDLIEPNEWHHCEICVSTSRGNAAELLVVSDDGLEPLEVWLREIDPVESTALTLRLDAWAKAAIQRFLTAIAQSIQERQEP
jgi:Fic family protein